MTEIEHGGTTTRSESASTATASRQSLSQGHGLGTRGRRGLAIVSLLALAAVVRFLPLYWSPHPATLDGFQYAWFASETLRTGALPISAFRVDSIVFTGLITSVSAVVGVDALRVTQPLSSLIGVFGVFTGVAVAHRVARGFDWARRRVSAAVVATGAILALNGIFLRRTMDADEEVLFYVLLPLTILALHVWLDDGSHTRRWAVPLGILLVTLPLAHIFSTLIAGLAIVGLVVAHAVQHPDRRTLLGGGAIAAGFWLYFGGYYQLAATVMQIAYVDRVVAFPGLFLAWGIILVVGVAWVWTTSSRARSLAVVVPLGVFYLVTAVNTLVSVYPGTPQTPTLVLVPVVALALPLLVGGVGMGLLTPHRSVGAIVVALLAGPLTVIGFSLTASLTPEYVNTAIRAQTFGHLPLAILAGLVIARLLATRTGLETDFASGWSGSGSADGGRSVLRTAAVALVLLMVVVSVPFAYLNLDTGTYPSTTLDSEFEAVGFASDAGDEWATDHSLSRVGVHYYRSDPTVSPTASWLSGGTSPTCRVLSQESWTTSGAHLFPFAPETVSEERYESWLGSRHVVYANTGRDPATVSLPVTAAGQGC
ncbi:glycosyltransferase family protein [Salinigranum halophilum]|uniref:hypothetical protein n=1 Tax=Salinigranum halophilum TaxID=2565931 RepID=UPI00115F6E5F|nr:hypothetical protein [Salinigranum halophilum]